MSFSTRSSDIEYTALFTQAMSPILNLFITTPPCGQTNATPPGGVCEDPQTGKDMTHSEYFSNVKLLVNLVEQSGQDVPQLMGPLD